MVAPSVLQSAVISPESDSTDLLRALASVRPYQWLNNEGSSIGRG